MNTNNFTSADPVHYVYLHRHPDTDEILYVGSGRNERAYRSTTTGESVRYGHRMKEHAELLRELQLNGYLPHDWVEFLGRGLTKSAACTLEQIHIREMKPRFNQAMGEKLRKVKGDLLRKAVELREAGKYYHEIAETLGVSTMAIWRGLNGKTKNTG